MVKVAHDAPNMTPTAVMNDSELGVLYVHGTPTGMLRADGSSKRKNNRYSLFINSAVNWTCTLCEQRFPYPLGQPDNSVYVYPTPRNVLAYLAKQYHLFKTHPDKSERYPVFGWFSGGGCPGMCYFPLDVLFEHIGTFGDPDFQRRHAEIVQDRIRTNWEGRVRCYTAGYGRLPRPLDGCVW